MAIESKRVMEFADLVSEYEGCSMAKHIKVR